MGGYSGIRVSGSDTDKPLNVQRRLAVIRRWLPKLPVKFLDCGCGAGGYVRALDRVEGIEAWGLEFQPGKVALAHESGSPPGRVMQGDIQHMRFPDGSFDAVMLNEVLEHVPDHDLGLSEVFRVLKPGGRLLVFSPNRCYPFETHGVKWRRSGRGVSHYIPFIPWIPLGLGQQMFSYNARNYWPRELAGLAGAHGFTRIGREFVWQTFENISGAQPAWMRGIAGGLRALSLTLEKVPLIRIMGVSQFLALQKPRAA